MKVQSEGKSTRQLLGTRGEKLARIYIEELGYEVLDVNWRSGHLELDIIANKEGVLHFIEVKTREGPFGGNPEENVHRRKLVCMFRAADAYLERLGECRQVQFDIIAITIRGEDSEFLMIEDVYI